MVETLHPDQLGLVDLNQGEDEAVDIRPALRRLADHLASTPSSFHQPDRYGNVLLPLGAAFRLREAFRLPRIIRECAWTNNRHRIERSGVAPMGVGDHAETRAVTVDLRSLDLRNFLSCTMIGSQPPETIRRAAERQLRLAAAALEAAIGLKRVDGVVIGPAVRKAESCAMAASAILDRPVEFECASPAIGSFPALPAGVIGADAAERAAIAAVIGIAPAIVDLRARGPHVRIGRHHVRADADEDALATMRAMSDMPMDILYP